jgi:hypothetical protein
MDEIPEVKKFFKIPQPDIRVLNHLAILLTKQDS